MSHHPAADYGNANDIINASLTTVAHVKANQVHHMRIGLAAQQIASRNRDAQIKKLRDAGKAFEDGKVAMEAEIMRLQRAEYRAKMQQDAKEQRKEKKTSSGEREKRPLPWHLPGMTDGQKEAAARAYMD